MIMGKPKMYGANKPADQKHATFPWPRKKQITPMTPKAFVEAARRRGGKS